MSSDKGPVSPPKTPFVGNLLEFSRAPFEYCREQASLGDVVELSLLGQRVYLLTEPEFVKRVLVAEEQRFRKPAFVTSALDPAIGESLLVSGGEEWRTQRETLQPAFYREQVEQYASTIVDTTARATANWEAGTTVEVTEEMQRITMTALVSSLFGDDVDVDEARVRAAVDHVVGRFGSVVSSMLPHWVPTPTNVRFVRALRTLSDVVDDVLEHGRAADADGPNVLALLVDADRDGRLSTSVVRDEILMFLVEGYGTTSLALTYLWYELGQHPDVRRRLFDELDEVVGGERPTVETVSQLTVAENVIRETLRKYPPIYGVFREPDSDVAFGDAVVPEGSLLCLPQFVIHKDERFYADPEAFRPERWAGDLEDAIPEYAYFPFGGGPRHCIGARFAMLQMKTILATIADRWWFDPESSGPLSLTMDLVARPEAPVNARLVSRSK